MLSIFKFHDDSIDERDHGCIYISKCVILTNECLFGWPDLSDGMDMYNLCMSYCRLTYNLHKISWCFQIGGLDRCRGRWVIAFGQNQCGIESMVHNLYIVMWYIIYCSI